MSANQPQDTYDFEREHWRWKEGLSQRVLRFRAIEALVQSIYEAQVCATCVTYAPLEELRAQAMEPRASPLLPGNGEDDVC